MTIEDIQNIAKKLKTDKKYRSKLNIVEQCFCPSYIDDDGNLQDCKCNKCKQHEYPNNTN